MISTTHIAAVPHGTARDGTRLLLVAADPGAAGSHRRHLAAVASASLHVLHAASLDAAEAMLHDTSFDAVLLDPALPDASAPHVVRALVRLAGPVPVIVLTRDPGEAAVAELLRAGAQDCLDAGGADGRRLLSAVRFGRARLEAARHPGGLAPFDPLTGLASRALFRDRLQQALARAERTGKLVAVLALDVDRFKTVNDTLGQRAGDALLVEAAQRLAACVRRTDTIARLGGDEFGLVLEGLDSPLAVEPVCRKISRALEAPLPVDGHELVVTASIGVSLYPADGTEADDLLRNADAAMSCAKARGGHACHHFTAEIAVRAAHRMTLESALRHAVQRGELTLHYQPKVCVQSGDIRGAEALLRWHSPQFGEVTPAEFIPIAEESGLIVPIGEWVLRRACADMRRWHDLGYDDLSVAVNLSARQFRHGDLGPMVAQALADSAVVPGRLELEITESVLMEDTEASRSVVGRLKALGVGLYLDDFGTGYSSLAYLKRFPIDGLKIDRAFVRELPGEREDAAITQAIIALSRALRLTVIAEGVETLQQLEFLRLMQCDLAQGFFFGRPVPYAPFLERLARIRHCTRAPRRVRR